MFRIIVNDNRGVDNEKWKFTLCNKFTQTRKRDRLVRVHGTCGQEPGPVDESVPLRIGRDRRNMKHAFDTVFVGPAQRIKVGAPIEQAIGKYVRKP